MGEKQQKKKKQEGLANGQPFMNSPGGRGATVVLLARLGALACWFAGFSLKAHKFG
jgi:hypothetical protein